MLVINGFLNMKPIMVKSSNPPTVEIDSCAHSAYIRFIKNGKIAKTVSNEKPGAVIAIDLDISGNVIGVELVGVREFNVTVLMTIAQIQAPRIDFARTRYVPARHSVLQEA